MTDTFRPSVPSLPWKPLFTEMIHDNDLGLFSLQIHLSIILLLDTIFVRYSTRIQCDCAQFKHDTQWRTRDSG